jgi:hypothetical protein
MIKRGRKRCIRRIKRKGKKEWKESRIVTHVFFTYHGIRLHVQLMKSFKDRTLNYTKNCLVPSQFAPPCIVDSSYFSEGRKGKVKGYS